MKNKRFSAYYLISLIGIFLICAYPLSMANTVVTLMRTVGSVPTEHFPKYIIPYAPIAFALLCGTALLPVFTRFLKRFAFLGASVTSLGIFLTSELLLESKVIVSGTSIVSLGSWQMYMCYVPPIQYETRTWTAIDVLMGDYDPTFKIHFYMISAVLIIAVLNCIYGFASVIATKDKTRVKVLTLQSISAAAFLGMCILACFTAFYRGGELTVSPLSALLMCVFFILLGITVGLFAASLAIGKRKALSVTLPAILASVTVFIMYVGEACLMSGHLYILGKGIIFEPLVGNFVSAFDLLVIILSGTITAVLAAVINKKYVIPSPTEK